MKIVFILILHLGLVACGNNATNTSLPCNRCNAFEELSDFFFDVNVNANATIFTGMLNKYRDQGLINYVQRDKFEEKIPETLQGFQNLQTLSTQVQSAIEKEICECIGGATKVCPESFTNASTIYPDPPGGLNSSAGPVVVNVPVFSCSNCRAIYRIQFYVNSPGDDRDGSIFWALIDAITAEEVLTPKETDHFKKILTFQYVNPKRGRNYDAGGEHVIKYINQKSPYECCKKLGPLKFSCTEGISKIEKAILLIKDYIDRSYHCPDELFTMIINFYVQDSITLKQWKVYDKMIKDQLKGRPNLVADFVLKDLKFNNAIKKLKDYEFEVNEDPNYDRQGTIIFELMREFEDKGLISQGQYAQGLVDWQGKEINQDQTKMAEYVRKKLIKKHGQ